jgi:hypothetical protein
MNYKQIPIKDSENNLSERYFCCVFMGGCFGIFAAGLG